MILLIIVYIIRKKICLHWFHFLIYSGFLIFHDLGMFKLYSTFPLGIEYDYWVHGLFGLVAALILLRA